MMSVIKSLKVFFQSFFENVCDIIHPEGCLFCENFIWSQNDWKPFCLECASKKLFSPSMVKMDQDILYSLGIYEDFLKKSIIRFKFGPSKKMARFFAICFFDIWKDQKVFKTIDCVCSVPLSKKRLLERGFDQSREMAEALSQLLRKPFFPLIKKVKNCVPQMSLNRKCRLSNVRDAYQLESLKTEIPIKKILLIDDVITTGSTLRECMKVLRSKNRKCSIVNMVLAKVPF